MIVLLPCGDEAGQLCTEISKTRPTHLCVYSFLLCPCSWASEQYLPLRKSLQVLGERKLVERAQGRLREAQRRLKASKR